MHASQVVASHGRTMPVNDLMYDVKLEYNVEGTVPLSQLLYQMQLTVSLPILCSAAIMEVPKHLTGFGSGRSLRSQRLIVSLESMTLLMMTPGLLTMPL